MFLRSVCVSSLAVLVGLGCAGPSSGPAESRDVIAVAGSEDETPPPESDPEPARPEVEFEDVAEPTRFVISEGEPPPELESVRTRLAQSRGHAWDVVQLANPIARRRLAAMVELLAYEHGGVYTYESAELGEGCRAALATERVVSVRCRFVWVSRDGGYTTHGRVVVRHFAIEGDVVRPFDARDILLDGTRPSDLMTERECISRVARTTESDRTAARVGCRVGLSSAQLLLEAEGLRVILSNRFSTVLPWAELRERLAPTGPLAWLFASVDRPPPPNADESMGYVLGDVLPLGELAHHVANLPPELRSVVRFVPHAGLAGELVVVGETPGVARAVARHLGQSVRRARWEERPMLMRRVRTREPADLLSSTDTLRRRLRRIAAGTHLVTTSEPRAARSPIPPHIRVVAASGSPPSWIPQTLLEDDPDCTPSGEVFLDSLPAEGREEAAQRLLVASTTTYRGGAASAAVLFATRIGQRSHIALRSLGEACAVGALIRQVDLPGYFFDAHLTSTEPEGGESLLVVGLLQGRTHRRYAVHRVSDGRRVGAFEPESLGDGRFDEGLPNARALQDGDTWWPLVLDGYDVVEARYRWNGRRLVEDAPPE